MSLKKRINSFTFPVLFFLLCACKNKQQENILVKLNYETLDSIFNTYGNDIAIVTCLRCECFVRDFNYRYNTLQEVPKNYVLLSDTLCNKFEFPVQYLPNKVIEEISDDIYNLTLLKKRGSAVKVRIVAVEESKRADKVAETFFKSDK